MPAARRADVQAERRFNEKPVKAPVAQGDKLGEVKIEIPGGEVKTVPLYADHSIRKLGFWGRILSNVKYLLFGAE